MVAENIEHHCLNNDFQLIYKNSHDDSFLLINTLDYNCNRNEKKKKKKNLPSGPGSTGAAADFQPHWWFSRRPLEAAPPSVTPEQNVWRRSRCTHNKEGKNIDLHLKEFSFITSRPGLGSAPDVHENTVTQRQRDRRDWYRWNTAQSWREKKPIQIWCWLTSRTRKN